jgi:hypothetical protein
MGATPLGRHVECMRGVVVDAGKWSEKEDYIGGGGECECLFERRDDEE